EGKVADSNSFTRSIEGPDSLCLVNAIDQSCFSHSVFRRACCHGMARQQGSSGPECSGHFHLCGSGPCRHARPRKRQATPRSPKGPHRKTGRRFRHYCCSILAISPLLDRHEHGAAPTPHCDGTVSINSFPLTDETAGCIKDDLAGRRGYSLDVVAIRVWTRAAANPWLTRRCGFPLRVRGRACDQRRNHCFRRLAPFAWYRLSV